jgi:hypothetical protein
MGLPRWKRTSSAGWAGGHVREFQLVVVDRGLILRGRAHTYYAKQLAQHAVMDATGLPILANEIEVC